MGRGTETYGQCAGLHVVVLIDGKVYICNFRAEKIWAILLGIEWSDGLVVVRHKVVLELVRGIAQAFHPLGLMFGRMKQ